MSQAVTSSCTIRDIYDYIITCTVCTVTIVLSMSKACCRCACRTPATRPPPLLLGVAVMALVWMIQYSDIVCDLKRWYYAPVKTVRPVKYSGTQNIIATVCVDAEQVAGKGQINSTKHLVSDLVIRQAWGSHNEVSNMFQAEPFVIYYANVTEHECGWGKKGYRYEHLKEALFQKFDELHVTIPQVQCVSAKDSLGNMVTFVWGTDGDKMDMECAYGMYNQLCVTVDSKLKRVSRDGL